MFSAALIHKSGIIVDKFIIVHILKNEKIYNYKSFIEKVFYYGAFGLLFSILAGDKIPSVSYNGVT